MDYIIHIAIIFVIYSILSLSLNLIVGYTGLLSVSQAAFYGIGAYISAITITKLGINFFVSLIIGIILTGAIAFLIGLVLSKFDDDYYALASLGFTIIIYSIFLNWPQLTRGPLGIAGIQRPHLFGINFYDNFSFLILAIFICIIIYLISKFIVNSSFGRVLKAIRDDELAAEVFGYNTHHFKLAIFVIGGAMAAIAGSLFASYITFIDPQSFTVIESVFILSIIILGGLANLRGSILGALFLILLPEILRLIGFTPDIAAQMRQLIYGVLLIVLMLHRPQGLVGEYRI